MLYNDSGDEPGGIMACECDNCETAKVHKNILPPEIAARVLELVPSTCTDQELMAAIQTASNEYNAREQAKYMKLLRDELWAKE